MILADKIIKLRKQLGWSQEDLAEKMNVSRQSVSKWESTSSIPDLNKIILLAEIFGVTTDYLVKDEIEEIDSIGEDKEPGIVRATLEDVTKYTETKIEMSKHTSKGVLLSIYSVIPLFFLLALAEGEQLFLTSEMAVGIGLVMLLLSISIGISFFLRGINHGGGFVNLEEDLFELSYGVRSVFKDKAQKYQSFYSRRLSLCISMIIISIIPLLLVSIFSESKMTILLMLVLMFVIIGAGIYLLIPSLAEYNVYNFIIGEGDYSPKKRIVTRRTEKFGAFYWTLVTAVYIGWSLWTMDWHLTWIVWPVAGIAFAAFISLIGMFDSEG